MPQFVAVTKTMTNYDSLEIWSFKFDWEHDVNGVIVMQCYLEPTWN